MLMTNVWIANVPFYLLYEYGVFLPKTKRDEKLDVQRNRNGIPPLDLVFLTLVYKCLVIHTSECWFAIS